MSEVLNKILCSTPKNLSWVCFYLWYLYLKCLCSQPHATSIIEIALFVAFGLTISTVFPNGLLLQVFWTYLPFPKLFSCMQTGNEDDTVQKTCARHEFNETCHSVIFHFMKKDSKQCYDTTTPESVHTKDESKRGSAFAFIFDVPPPQFWGQKCLTCPFFKP